MNSYGRVAVLEASQSFSLRATKLPEPSARQVRVRLEGCGICGSNLPVWEGRPWFTYPIPAGSPGHEGWGYVDAIGSEVEDVKVGQRVAALSYHAFAEYDVAEASNVVALPPELDGQPFPGEALGCALNVFHRSDIRAEHTVAVVGIGFMGALLTNLASRTGARVIAISRRESALLAAARMGAQETMRFGDDWGGCAAAVREITGGVGCERVIEATGFQLPLDLATELTAERGRLIIAGFHQDGMRQVNLQLWNWRGLDVINAHERDPRVYVEGIRAAATAVATGRLDPTPLYTDEFPLGSLQRAFRGLKDRNGSFMKALVTYV